MNIPLSTVAGRLRIVFDTNVVVSALAFGAGRSAWLRTHWLQRHSIPLVSSETAAELRRVLQYRRLKLSPEYQIELLGDYLPYCETIIVTQDSLLKCRDPKDQIFLDLAQSGQADLLITGDEDLLVLAGQAEFAIETPDTYRRRVYPAAR